VEGDWADGVTGLRGMRVEIAMMRTPDGHSRLEMSRFLAPPVVADHRSAPVNALGYLRVMFTVEDIDDTLARLGKRGAKLVGEVVQYKDMYRLCYIRGPEGILIGLAQQPGSTDRDRRAYLDIMAEQLLRLGVEVLAWCLMTNHTHIVAIPNHQGDLARAIGEAHRRYTRMKNFADGVRGYLFQGDGIELHIARRRKQVGLI
jgi:hypothetical protein